MSNNPPPPKSVLDTVLDWSQDRPAWQRDALRRIVTQGQLSPTDIEELTELCKKGWGGQSALVASPLESGHLPANPGAGAAVTLLSVNDVKYANDLAPQQTLGFEPNGITIIYGDNGSGKSGYARILKRACRARHTGRIEPNIYGPQPASAAATATLLYALAGAPQSAEQWHDGSSAHQLLSAISVFDSDCASIHVEGKNEVAFRPFGLDVPDALAGACVAVKDALSTEHKQLSKARNPLLDKPTWKATTAAGKALGTLRRDTSFTALEALAHLSDADTARMERLKEDLSRNPAKAAVEYTLKADNIKRVHDMLSALVAAVDDSALGAIRASADTAATKKEAARLAADHAFSGEPLPGVGGDTWRALWDSARRYSDQIAYPKAGFPPATDDALCVLCQQQLGADARTRMTRFEEFIQQDTAKAAAVAEQQARAAIRSLTERAIGTRHHSTGLRELALHDAAAARRARRMIAAARMRRILTLRSLATGTPHPQLPSLDAPSAEMADLERQLRAHADELLKSSDEAARKTLEAELAELNDRVTLGSMLPIVREDIERQAALHFLEQCQADTSTNAITMLGNDIADSVITPKLRDRFQQEIVRLAAEKVRVEIVRSGGKYGSPQYQVRLFAKPTAKVEDVLSEGEKTCVALAAFLTELATADHRSALVFDDPVSSLDHKWRKRVAQRLVAEAEHRPIIVFTHDLIFANDVIDLADKKRPLRMQTLSRGAGGAGMVSEGLPWKGKGTEDRIDRLEKEARAAKKLYDANQEEAYETEATNIYTRLRASWERALEEIVFFRVVQRHRDYIDTKGLKKVTVLTEADCDAFHAGFRKCSDIVDAHDPSSGRNGAAPPPAEMLQDIQTFKDWTASLRDRQKKVA